MQIYCEAPQGKLGQPVRRLQGFVKTRLLQPGEKQRLTVRVTVHSLASYDDEGVTGQRSAYVLEAGLYRFYVGTSVRRAVSVGVDGNSGGYEVEALRVVKQLQEALAPVEPFARLRPGARREDGVYEVAYAEAPTRRISLAERIERHMPQTLPQTGNRGHKLRDVHEGRVGMETFIAQLNDDDLAAIVRGEGMNSPLVTPGTAAAFGGVTDRLFSYGIPVGCATDGPSGVRMDGGHQATQVPVGTLLAATWNVELVEELYVLEGREAAGNNIDALLGPGLNIRRSPLNGRNFEYFSEDPLVTGLFATACTRGIMQGGSNATLKHYACNNQEAFRNRVDAVVSERALREIYLKGFEMAVREGGANCVMTAYNAVNGHWSATNYDLNTTILRGEWGFVGIVMTDWWSVLNDVVHGGPTDRKHTNWMLRAQNDLYMVVINRGAEVNAKEDLTLDCLADGTLTRGELQRTAMNICRFLMAAPVFSRKQEFAEKTVVFAANPALERSRAEVQSVNGPVRPAAEGTILIEVEQAGVYRMLARVMSPEPILAQCACRVLLNGEVLATVHTNGTEGKWVIRKQVKAELAAGLYELTLDFIKPGMLIDWIEFKPLRVLEEMGQEVT